MTLAEPFRVLVAEKIADTGVEMLRERFDVDLGTDWSREDLLENIGSYHGILIRSATKLDAEVIERADNLRVVGRAGVGVDNVDVAAASKRGIIVANAPEANTVAAAEHTVALMLALARNIPQAHASPHQRQVGALQVRRHRGRGQDPRRARLRPHRPARRDPGPRVRHARRRLRPVRQLRALQASSASRRPRPPRTCSPPATSSPCTCPKTPETQGFLNAETLAQCKDGVRIINVARGPLVVDADLQAALDSGKVAGAALDVFAKEPITDHPLFGYPNVVVTPHLGASTAEAQDRAGVQTAEQVVPRSPAASSRPRSTSPPSAPRTWRCSARSSRSRSGSGGSPRRWPSGVERVEVEHMGRIAERDTRLLTLSVLTGVFAGRTEEDVNLVNAPTLAEERGIAVSERRETSRPRLRRPRAGHGVAAGERVRVVGTTLGQLHRPHLLEAWGQRFDLQIDDPHLTLFRYSDVPGMVGRVGSSLGEHGINISAAAVGRQPRARTAAAATSR